MHLNSADEQPLEATYANTRLLLIQRDLERAADHLIRSKLSPSELRFNEQLRKQRDIEIRHFKAHFKGFLPAQRSILDIKEYLKLHPDNFIWKALKSVLD
jgi:hypothetical protein